MSINKTTLQKMAKQVVQRENVVEVQVDDKNVEIKVKPVLPLADFCSAAQEICDIQFTVDENGKEMYAPYLSEFAERFVTVSRFSDLDLLSLKKGNDDTYGSVEPIWQFLWSDVYSKIAESINSVFYWALQGAAAELVDERRKKNEAGPAKIWNDLDGLVDRMKQSFGEMTPEDLEKTREAIDKLTEIDEGKIVELMR